MLVYFGVNPRRACLRYESFPPWVRELFTSMYFSHCIRLYALKILSALYNIQNWHCPLVWIGVSITTGTGCYDRWVHLNTDFTVYTLTKLWKQTQQNTTRWRGRMCVAVWRCEWLWVIYLALSHTHTRTLYKQCRPCLIKQQWHAKSEKHTYVHSFPSIVFEIITSQQ